MSTELVIRVLLLWSVAIAMTPLGPDAQSVGLRLRGIVVEKETALPVAGVEVSMVGANARAVTDDRGEFSLERAAPGTMVLLFRRLGFRAGSLTVDRLADDTTTIRFAM